MGTDSRAAGALLARASTLHLQTLNLLHWGRLRKKCPSTHYCIQKTLNEWSSQINPDLVREFPDVLECTVSHAVEKINPDEREEMKVSAKLFIVESNSSSSTRNAVDMACSVFGVAQLDSVIMASPPIEDGVNLSLEHLQPYWEELENLVQRKKIVAIGTSDLDKTQLEQLLSVGTVAYGSWFEHIRGWLSMRGCDNFLVLYYEDMKKDTMGTIKKICDFLGKKLEPDELNLVLKYSSFQVMKENSMSNFTLMKKGFTLNGLKFMRKGTIGDWKNHFTVAQAEAFDKVFQEKMAGFPPGMFPWE